MKRHSPLSLFTLLLLAVWVFQSVQAAPVLTINPASLTLSQTSPASYAIALSGATGSATYSLSLTGLPTGANYSFSPSTISASGKSVLTIQTSNPPVYCPNSYSFNVTATNVAVGSDRASSSANLVVTQAGPPLSVSVTTDKSTYTTGESVQVSVSINRGAEGTLTITPPSGPPSTFHYQYTGSASFTKSFSTAIQPAGRWAAVFQADDYCGGVGNGVAYFDVVDTYSVSVSLSGVPSSISVAVQVDGQSQGSMGGSETKSLSFKAGTQHSIIVDQYVQGATDVRYFASQNSWSVGSAGNHTFSYITQYYFTVGTNPVGLIQISGNGWYNAGTQVQAGAPQITNDPAGVPYAFSNWQVDGVQRPGNPILVTMDGPHAAVATFQPNAITTIVSSITSARTSAATVTITTIITGTTTSTRILTGTGNQTVFTGLTSTVTAEQTVTITTVTAQTFATTAIVTELQDPSLELLLGSILIISALVIVITLAKRFPTGQPVVCAKCGFRNPPTATSFCVNCGQLMKGGRSK